MQLTQASGAASQSIHWYSEMESIGMEPATAIWISMQREPVIIRPFAAQPPFANSQKQ